MAACGYTPLRIDHLDNNETVNIHLSKSLYDGDDTIYFCYAQTTQKPPGNADTYRVYLRKYSIANGTLTTAVQVSDDDAAVIPLRYNPQEPFMVRLDDGTLICAWSGALSGGTTKSYVRESSDDGATWGSLTQINIHSSPINEVIAGMATDGTTVWIYIQGSGSGGTSPNVNGIIWWKVRTAADTWSVGQQVGSTDSITTNSWFIYPEQTLYGFRAFYQVDADVGFFVAARYGPGNSTKDELKALRITDATTSPAAAEIAIDSWTVDTAPFPKIVDNTDPTDTVIRMVYLSENPAPLYPILASSDDDGASWSLIGTPTQITSDAANGFDQESWGSVMDGAGNWFIGQTFSGEVGKSFRAWKGGDATSGWSLLAECQLPATLAQNGPAEMFHVGTDIYYVFNYVDDADTDGDDEWHICMIKMEGVAEDYEEPTPPEPEVGTAMFRRGVIQVEKLSSDFPGGGYNVVPIEKARDPFWGGE